MSLCPESDIRAAYRIDHSAIQFLQVMASVLTIPFIVTLYHFINAFFAQEYVKSYLILRENIINVKEADVTEISDVEIRFLMSTSVGQSFSEEKHI